MEEAEPGADPSAAEAKQAARVEARILHTMSKREDPWLARSKISPHIANRDRHVLPQILDSMLERGVLVSKPGPRPRGPVSLAISTPETIAEAAELAGTYASMQP